MDDIRKSSDCTYLAFIDRCWKISDTSTTVQLGYHRSRYQSGPTHWTTSYHMNVDQARAPLALSKVNYYIIWLHAL